MRIIDQYRFGNNSLFFSNGKGIAVRLYACLSDGWTLFAQVKRRRKLCPAIKLIIVFVLFPTSFLQNSSTLPNLLYPHTTDFYLFSRIPAG